LTVGADAVEGAEATATGAASGRAVAALAETEPRDRGSKELWG
jgi:hypothetical protein